MRRRERGGQPDRAGASGHRAPAGGGAAEHPSARLLGTERMGIGHDRRSDGPDPHRELRRARRRRGARHAARRARVRRARWSRRTSPPGSALAAHRRGRPAGAAVAADDRSSRSATRCSSWRASARARRASSNGGVSSLGPFDANWEYALERAILTTAMNPGLGGGPLLDMLGPRGRRRLAQPERDRPLLARDPDRALPRRTATSCSLRAAADARRTRAWLGRLLLHAERPRRDRGPAARRSRRAGGSRAGRRRPRGRRPRGRGRAASSTSASGRIGRASAVSLRGLPRTRSCAGRGRDGRRRGVLRSDAAPRMRRSATSWSPICRRSASRISSASPAISCCGCSCASGAPRGLRDRHAVARARRRLRRRRLRARHRAHRRRLRHLRRRRPQHGEPGRRLVLRARADAGDERRPGRGGAQARHAHPSPGEGDRVAAPDLPRGHLRGARARRSAHAPPRRSTRSCARSGASSAPATSRSIATWSSARIPVPARDPRVGRRAPVRALRRAQDREAVRETAARFNAARRPLGDRRHRDLSLQAAARGACAGRAHRRAVRDHRAREGRLPDGPPAVHGRAHRARSRPPPIRRRVDAPTWCSTSARCSPT